jgi:dephospho-CoA kinase
LILGLTGGYCVGKSTAAAILGDDGWTIVNVDALGHRALELQAAQVAGLIGPGAIKPDGSPDRRVIGKAVFSDPALLGRFEAIVHPSMNALVAETVASAGGKVCVDAALLYRLPIADSCDAIIEVRASLVSRLRRGRVRDGLGAPVVLARIASQRPLLAAARRFAGRVIVVYNLGNHDALRRRIREAVALAEYRTALN